MNTVEERGIIKFVGQFAKQIRVLEHVGHGVLGVADKDHGGLCAQRLHTPREGFIGHVVFHDVDQGLVHPLLLAGKLVEGDTIPVADQANLTGGVVHEQLGNRNFSAGDENTVGRELGVNMGLAGSLGAQLDQVVIAFAKRDQAEQLGQLVAPAEHFRVEADTLQEQVHPLVNGELLAGLEVAIKVKVGELDRLEGRQDPRTGVLVLGEFILEIGYAPHAADQELGMLLDGA